MTKYTALICLLLTLCWQCRKAKEAEDNPYGLPAATQSGAGTFGCLIDGKPWVAHISINVLDPTLRDLVMYYDETGIGKFNNNGWGIIAQNVGDSLRSSIILTAQRFDKPGVLGVENNLEATILFGNSQKISQVYELDFTQPYRIEITKLDTVRDICAGRFEFFAVTYNRADTIHITEGRFDKIYDVE